LVVNSPGVQEQQKNITEQLGQNPPGLNTARERLAGAGTQTAALAFGGLLEVLQEQQKNMTVQLGQIPGSLNTARYI
jgi:hypothetical protein